MLTASFLYLHWRKSRTANSIHQLRYIDYTCPPNAATQPPTTNIPFQDISGFAYPQVFRITAPQDAWNLPNTPPGVVRGPIIPDTRNTSTETPRPRNDRLSEATVGSHVSSSSDGAMMSIEGFINRDALPAYRQPLTAGESQGPPRDTQQNNWSTASNFQVKGPEEVPARASASVKTSMSDGRVRRSTMDDMPFDP